jgi:hypothetical protein
MGSAAPSARRRIRGAWGGLPSGATVVFWSWLGSRLLFFLTLALSLRPRTAAELVERLGQWDGAHYLKIAAQGYAGDEFAFFPLFPYTTKAVAALVHVPPLLAALLLVNAAFLAGLLVLHQLTERCLGTAIARNVVLLTCLNPMAIFFAIPYTESFYLLFTGLTFAALLRRATAPWGLGRGGLGGLAVGLLGGLAAATRPTGVVLVASIGVGFWRQRRWRAGLVAVLLTLGGLAVVMAIGLQRQGDALAFLHAQQAWEVTPGFNLAGLPFWRRQLSQALLGPLNTKAGALVDLAHPAWMAAILLGAGLAWGPGRRWPTASFALSVLAFVGYWLLGGMPALCLLFSVGCLPLLVWGYGRLPLELWLFGVTSVMAYLLKQNTISLERHVFATVPLLMLYGAWFSAHPRWLGFLLGFGSLLSVIYSVRFAQGHWIG